VRERREREEEEQGKWIYTGWLGVEKGRD